MPDGQRFACGLLHSRDGQMRAASILTYALRRWGMSEGSLPGTFVLS